MSAIAAVLPVAVALVLAALPVVLLSVVLVTKRPASVARAFLGGWIAGLAVTATVALLAADLLVLVGGGRSTAWLEVAVAAVLVVLAARTWRARPRAGEPAEAPGWVAAAETMSSRRAAGLGFAVAAANPKNLVLVLAGSAVIADASSVAREQVVALVVFVVVASLGVAAPVVMRALLGERIDPTLARLDAWMTRNSAAIMALVLTALAVALVAKAVSG